MSLSLYASLGEKHALFKNDFNLIWSSTSGEIEVNWFYQEKQMPLSKIRIPLTTYDLQMIHLV